MSRAPADSSRAEIDRLSRELAGRDFELASLREQLARDRQLLDGWRATVREQERELIDGEARLNEAELQVERLEAALASLRAGRGYRLMRVLWRLRRPFRRS